MSAQQLADACAALGHEVPRSVLANLESGRRETVSVTELVVLAEALGVSPVELLLPLGHDDGVEILPEREVSTTEALLWFRGDNTLPEGDQGTVGDGSSTVASYLVHKQTVDRWFYNRMYAEMIRNGKMEGGELEAQRHDAEADRARRNLQSLRQIMRARELNLPPAPPLMALPN